MTVKCLHVCNHWIVQQLAVNVWLSLEDTVGGLKISFIFFLASRAPRKNLPCATKALGEGQEAAGLQVGRPGKNLGG